MKLKHTKLKQPMLFQVFLLISEKYPNPPLFEERNLVFFPTQHPHFALPFLIIPHWLSLSHSCHFSIVSWNLFHPYAIFSHCFITILNIPHCCSNCMVIIFVILSSFVITIPNYPIIVPTISYCSHHSITLPSSCCFKHPIVSLINPCCHPCCYSLFSFVMFAISYHFGVFPSLFKPN